MTQLIPNGKQQFVDVNGRPLVFGKVYFYSVGTSTPKDTFQDVDETILNTNPVICDARGQASIYGTGSYRQVLRDFLGDLIWDQVVPDASEGMNTFIANLLNHTDPTLGAGLVGRATRQVNALAELRTVVGRYANDMIYLERHTTGYNRGGGPFIWDAASVVADDGVTTIAVTGVVTGRWIRLYSFLTASMFGLKAVAGFDNVAALAAMETFLRAQGTNQPKVLFEHGRYEYSVSPNWAIEHADINPAGTVYLRNTGTGHSVIIDGGATTGGCNGLKMGNNRKFIVEGGAGSMDGVYVRSLLQESHIGFQINGAGTLYSGMNIEFGVCAQVDITCSNNVQGYTWYSKPANGLKLNRRGAGELASYLYFPNPIIENVGSSCALLDWAQGNIFVGGTMEGSASTGIKLTANAIKNKVFGTDYEVNVDHDVFCEGRGNEFYGLNTENRITFNGGAAVINKVIGGSHSKIFTNAGTLHNLISGATYNQNNDGSTITDLSGGKLRLRDNYNQGIGRIENVPPGSPIPIAVGASPFAFQNLGDNDVDIIVSGAGVNGISITRNGIATVIGAVGGMFTLTPIDILTITYAGAATMTELTR